VGQLVRTLAKNIHVQGVFEVTWNAIDDSGNKVPEGIYFCKIIINGKSDHVKRIILLD
jgi:flagellar hook assembly protein FlgD